MKYLACLAALSLTLVASAKIETWTNQDGNRIEAELVSADDKQVSFRKADGTGYVYLIAKLSEADQLRVREAAATLPAMPAPTPPARPALAGKLTSEIAGKLVSVQGKTLSPYARENVIGAKYYAIYFSAHWCPPCRGFTPELVNAYKDLKAKNPAFEVVFVSSDNSNDDMKNYMREYNMPWPAIRFDSAKSIRAVSRFGGRGIPNLVFVTADGEVLSSSYDGEDYVGPQKVLRDIKKKLSEGS